MPGTSSNFRDQALKKKLVEKAEKHGVGSHVRHIFLCADQTEPKCCSREEGIEAWKHLKHALHERGLDAAGKIYRTKANCLRLCVMGPIALVMPDNIWYHSCTPKVLDRIIEEHLINNKIVEEYRISIGE